MWLARLYSRVSWHIGIPGPCPGTITEQEVEPGKLTGGGQVVVQTCQVKATSARLARSLV